MDWPPNPIEAVTHENPYPYYAELVANRPLYCDASLDTWIATSADAVRSVMTEEKLRVRPTSEPIPATLAGTAVGDLFGRLIRMNEGAYHECLKPAVSRSLQSADRSHIADVCRYWAETLLFREEPHPGIDVPPFAFRLTAFVIGSLLGVPNDKLEQTAIWTSYFAPCIVSNVTPEQIDRGANAVRGPIDLIGNANASGSGECPRNLFTGLANAARQAGVDQDDAVDANAVGYLFQAYDATAGLTANSLLALSRFPEVRQQIENDPKLIDCLVEEVLRFDMPIQNTRRFAGTMSRWPAKH